MEKTFQELWSELQKETGDSSVDKLIEFKKWLNAGIGVFQGKLKIPDEELTRYASTVTGQATYQNPESARRVKGIRYDDGSQKIPLVEVVDDMKWQRMVQVTGTGTPVYWHKKHGDMYEIYPSPQVNGDNNLLLTCKMSQRPLYASDYSTGTASIDTGNNNVLGFSTVFTKDMVGRRFRFADGVGDGTWYPISGFSSITGILIENDYSAEAVNHGNFIIAEVPRLPRELHQTLYDYAFWRYLLGARDFQGAREYKAIWQEQLQAYQPDDDTEEQVYPPEPDVDLFPNLMQVPDRII